MKKSVSGVAHSIMTAEFFGDVDARFNGISEPLRPVLRTRSQLESILREVLERVRKEGEMICPVCRRESETVRRRTLGVVNGVPDEHGRLAAAEIFARMCDACIDQFRSKELTLDEIQQRIGDP